MKHQVKPQILLLIIAAIILLPIQAFGESPYLLQTDNLLTGEPGKLSIGTEGGYEFNPTAGWFVYHFADYQLLSFLNLGFGISWGGFQAEETPRLESLDLHAAFEILDSPSWNGEVIVQASTKIGEPVIVPYTGNLESVSLVVAPRADGTFGLSAAALFDWQPEAEGFLGNMEFLAEAGLGIRGLYTDNNLLAENGYNGSLNWLVNISPSYRLSDFLSVQLQSNLKGVVQRGISLNELAQVCFQYNDVFAASAGVSFPVIGSTGWNIYAGLRWSGKIPQSMEIIQEDENIRIRLYLNFPGDRAELFRPVNKRYHLHNSILIRETIRMLEDYPDYDLVVEGYANRANFNLTFKQEQNKELLPLSKKRAASVKDALIEYGIEAARIRTRAYGGENPLADFTDSRNCWKNRRVEILLVKRK